MNKTRNKALNKQPNKQNEQQHANKHHNNVHLAGAGCEVLHNGLFEVGPVQTIEALRCDLKRNMDATTHHFDRDGARPNGKLLGGVFDKTKSTPQVLSSELTCANHGLNIVDVSASDSVSPTNKILSNNY